MLLPGTPMVKRLPTLLAHCTMPTVFESDRTFFVRSYEDDRGGLELRTRRQSGFERGIAVVFQDVRALELRVWLKGLRIEDLDPSAIANRPSAPLGVFEHGNRAYRVVSQDWEGWIVGGIVTVREEPEPALPFP